MKRFIIFIAIFFIPLFAGAEGNIQKVYLNEAIDVALKNNIDLEASKINIELAKNQIKSASRFQNPSLDYYHFMGDSASAEPKQIGLSQTLEVAKRSARKSLAKSELALTKKQVSYTTFDLKMDVREAYINLVASKSILSTLEQQLQLQKELHQIASNRVKLNQAPAIDVIQAEIALNQMLTQVNSAKVNVKKSLAYFNKVINPSNGNTYDSMDKLFSEENNFEEMLTPPPTEDFPSIEEIVEEALENRFDIQISKQEIDVAEKNLALVTRNRVPDIQITGGYAYLPARNSTSGSYENGGYAGASLVNLPVFYNYSPEIKNATLKLEQAKLNLKSTKNKAIKDVTSAYERFLTAAENLNQYESKIITGSEELIETSKKSYEKGEIDIVSLIVMKQSYKSIIIGYTQALAEYYNSWTSVLREINDEKFDITEDL